MYIQYLYMLMAVSMTLQSTLYVCSLSVYVFCFLMCLCTGLHVYAMGILIPISVMINWHSDELWPSGITPFVCLDFLYLVLLVVVFLFVCIL